MYIEKVEIKNWKNFRNPGPVLLGRRLFLIGPNASGKSNFLDVFRFLRDLAISGGGLSKAVDLRSGVSAIRCLAARRYSDILVSVELKDNARKNGNGAWLYTLVFNQDKQRRPIIKEEHVEHDGTVLLHRPELEDKGDTLRLTQTALEQITANRKFRPVADFFRSISYEHLLPQLIRDPISFSPRQVENDPYGRDFLQRVQNTSVKVKNPRLQKILQVLKVAVPQLENLEVKRDKQGVPHLEGIYEHWRPHGSRQNESQFSDGTLRLFGLLWSLFEGDGPLLMEEPELSLHAELVRNLPQMIETTLTYRKVKRQVIISTHSREILSESGIGGEEVLWLEPTSEGTLLKSPTSDPELRDLLENGLSVGEVVMPKTAPKDLKQLYFSLRY